MELFNWFLKNGIHSQQYGTLYAIKQATKYVTGIAESFCTGLDHKDHPMQCYSTALLLTRIAVIQPAITHTCRYYCRGTPRNTVKSAYITGSARDVVKVRYRKILGTP